MIGVAAIRDAPKRDVDLGRWSTGKKMSRSSFPIRRGAPYRLSATWTWRVIRFTCAEEPHRLLVAFRPDLHEYRAMLVRDHPDGDVVLCRLEHHGSHPGWHLHYQPFREKQAVAIRTLSERRRNCDADGAFGGGMVSTREAWALTVALDVFGLRGAADGSREATS